MREGAETENYFTVRDEIVELSSVGSNTIFGGSEL